MQRRASDHAAGGEEGQIRVAVEELAPRSHRGGGEAAETHKAL